MVDVRFVNYAFPATGAPLPGRTMPNRLADIKNVKDFGAKGDGATNDTAAIQAAVDWTAGPNRGIIFFPPGFYTITSAITLNYDPSPGQPGLSIHLTGSGAGTTYINITSSYAIDRHLATPNNTAHIVIEKMSLGSAIRVGSCNSVVLRDLIVPGITTEDSPGNSSQNIAIRSCQINTAGLIMGGSGIIEGCDWISCDVAARMYGTGWAIYGGRIERCNTAYLIGLDSGAAATFTGTVAHTGTNDNSGVLTVTAVTSGTLKPWQQLSDSGVNVPAGVFITGQLTGSTGSTGTYSITNPTFTISSGQTIKAIGNDVGASGFVINAGSTEGNWNGAIFAGTCSGFYLGSMGFLGHDNGNSGVNTGILPTQYHLVVGPKASDGVFQGLHGVGDMAVVAGCRVDTAASRANLLFLACEFADNIGHAGGAVDWKFPSNAFTAQWMNSNVSPVWTFTQLPSGGNVLQGDQFAISDPNNNTWGGNVTTSGASGQVLVRWNGSNWTVVGK